MITTLGNLGMAVTFLHRAEETARFAQRDAEEIERIHSIRREVEQLRRDLNAKGRTLKTPLSIQNSAPSLQGVNQE